MSCWICQSKLVWLSDDSYEDRLLDGDGMVTTLKCSNPKCDVERVEFFVTNEKEEEDGS